MHEGSSGTKATLSMQHSLLYAPATLTIIKINLLDGHHESRSKELISQNIRVCCHIMESRKDTTNTTQILGECPTLINMYYIIGALQFSLFLGIILSGCHLVIWLLRLCIRDTFRGFPK